jgi:hypothetical protein
MSGGWYEPLPTSFFEACQAYAYFRSVNSVSAATFLPSSRSVAFRKTTWEEVGGYPETTYTAEDTVFDLAVRRLSGRIVFAPRALVYWKLRPTLRTYAAMIYRYGFGDGFCRILPMKPLKNLAKLAVAVVLIAAGIAVHWSAFVVLLIYWWLLPFLSRPADAFRPQMAAKYPLIALLKVVSDAAYVMGYVEGLMTMRHPEFRRILDAADAEGPRA